jgi:hypothetical protein
VLAYVSIFIAVLSLIVAATALFFQHLYYADELICLLTDFCGSRDPDGTLNVGCRISVSNGGTRALMLESANMGPRVHDRIHSGYTGYHGKHRNLTSIPCMLPKGEFVHVELAQTIPASTLSNLLERRVDAKKPLEFYVRMIFVTVAGERMEFDERIGTFEPVPGGHTFTRFDTSPVKIGGKRVRLDWNVV